MDIIKTNMRFSFQNQNEIQLSNCEKSPTFSFDFGKKQLSF